MSALGMMSPVMSTLPVSVRPAKVGVPAVVNVCVVLITPVLLL